MIEAGRWRVRLGLGAADMDRIIALRSLCFRDGRTSDRDAFDDRCLHVLIEDRLNLALAGYFRLTLMPAERIAHSYSAQFYDLARLAIRPGPIAEVGRFCLHPGIQDPDVLRLTLGGLAGIVDRRGVRMLVGCTSFRGVHGQDHAAAFAALRQRYLAPEVWSPERRAAEIVEFPDQVPDRSDPSKGLRAMPPLLRSYLSMGARVGGHAVVDRDLGTLHVFTGLEIARVPATRVRALRALMAALPR